MLSGYKTYIVVAAMIGYQFLAWYLYGTPIDIMKILEAAGLGTLRAGVASAAK